MASGGGVEKSTELLSLAEVEKILKDVQADDVKILQSPKRCEFTDYMVIATARSPWHVRNISEALIYKVKQKQKGAKRMLLSTLVRPYYNFEGLLKAKPSNMDVDHYQDLENAFVNVRRKNNSKKRSQPQVHS